MCAHAHTLARARAHTTTCQERNASNFFVIWQPFNKTRELCPHTPSSSHDRQGWREEKAVRRRGKKADGASDVSFSYLKSFDSLNLSLQVAIFLSLNRPLFSTLDGGGTNCVF